jgi:ankyrin repeat protein
MFSPDPNKIEVDNHIQIPNIQLDKLIDKTRPTQTAPAIKQNENSKPKLNTTAGFSLTMIKKAVKSAWDWAWKEIKYNPLFFSKEDIALAKVMHQPDEKGITPLMLACRNGNIQTVKKMAKLGPINVPNPVNFGATILHDPEVIQNREMVNLLLRLDPSLLEASDFTHQTPLHVAAKSNHPDAVELLLSKMSEDKIKEAVNAKDAFGFSPIDYALSNRADSILSSFINDPKVDIKSLPGYGKEIVDISQEVLSKNFLKYLALKNRDTSVITETHCCNGLSFLYQYYSRLGREADFDKMREIIAKWDGSPAGLKETDSVSRFPEQYHNVEELFEQWINDVA